MYFLPKNGVQCFSIAATLKRCTPVHLFLCVYQFKLLSFPDNFKRIVYVEIVMAAIFSRKSIELMPAAFVY